jgi:phytoene dehydrogenase-like protein
MRNSSGVEGPGGKAFTVYRDLDRLERHMKEIAPEDAKVIDDYVRGIRKMTGYNIMAMQLGGIGRKIGVLPYIGTISKWAKVTVGNYADRFKDPFMKRAFPLVHYGIPSVPMIGNMATLALLYKQDMGWPSGGSLPFAMNIEKRYLELGGKVNYGRKVDKVIVKENKAIGVRMADGAEHRSDHSGLGRRRVCHHL